MSVVSASVLALFGVANYAPAMPPDPPLVPATPDEIAQSLAHALRFAGRKPVHTADDVMVRITAERLVPHLELAGFVVMRKPPGAAHRAGG